MRIRTTLAALVFALPLAPGCSGDAPTAPLEDAVIEPIAGAEILATGSLGDLTDDEKAFIRAALVEAREKLRALRAALRAGEIDRQAARARARAIHQELLETLSRVLTEEEIARLLHRDPTTVDLTEEQARAIRALRERFRAFVREQRALVEAGEISAREARAHVHEAARRLRAEICGDVLTPGQAAHVRFCRVDRDRASDREG